MYNLILIGGRVLIMLKIIYEFNDIIWKFWKDLFGKGLERIYMVFVENMVVLILYGNLILIEIFIVSIVEGCDMVYLVWIKMI